MLFLPIVVLVYFLAVAVHEAGHFSGFEKNGIRMRAIFVTVFLLIRESDGWKLKVRPNSVTLLGGVAIPDLPVVKDREHFKRLQRAYARAVLDGPIASVLFCFAVLLLTMPFFFLSTDGMVRRILSVVAFSVIAITVLLLIGCMMKTETVIGDFPAYRLCKSDSSFVAMQLYQYAAFSSDPELVRRKNRFLKELMLEDLKTKYRQRNFRVFTLNTIDIFVMEYLTGVSEELPETVREYVRTLLLSPVVRKKIPHSEVGIALWFHMIRLLSLRQKTWENALEEYRFLMDNINGSDPVNRYLTRQIEHVLGLADHSEFLKEKKNIRVSSVHGLWRNFEGYYMDEIKLNHDAIEQSHR